MTSHKPHIPFADNLLFSLVAAVVTAIWLGFPPLPVLFLGSIWQSFVAYFITRIPLLRNQIIALALVAVSQYLILPLIRTDAGSLIPLLHAITVLSYAVPIIAMTVATAFGLLRRRINHQGGDLG